MPEQACGSGQSLLSGFLRRLSRPLLVILVLILGVVMFAAITELPTEPVGLREVFGERQQRAELMHQAEVNNPVTAVLLSFRAYDTFLEVAVLVLALWAAPVLKLADPTRATRKSQDLLFRVISSIFLPVAIIVGGELLWLGSDYPGGAFQAGTVLGGGLILVRLTGVYGGLREGGASQQIAAVIGFLVFGILGFMCLPLTGTFLDYPPGRAKVFIIVIETAVMISVAIIFLGLFDRTVTLRLTAKHTAVDDNASADGQTS